MNHRLPPSGSTSSTTVPGWIAIPIALIGLAIGAVVAVLMFGVAIAVIAAVAVVGLGFFGWMRLRGKSPADVLAASIRRAAEQQRQQQDRPSRRTPAGPVVDIEAREVPNADPADRRSADRTR